MCVISWCWAGGFRGKLALIDAAYETYGQLNEAGDNVVLICHTLSGLARFAEHTLSVNKRF